jgi:hypothetical protein
MHHKVSLAASDPEFPTDFARFDWKWPIKNDRLGNDPKFT